MLFKFFITCNKIGAFTLGGGYAMIPIMEREFVDKNGWMDRQEFMDIMVVAQTTPGIFAIDMASHIGYKLRGIRGGITGALGTFLLRRASRRGGTHCRPVLQDGTDCQHNTPQPLDSSALLRPDSIAWRVADTHHHCGRNGRMAVGQMVEALVFRRVMLGIPISGLSG